MSQLADADRVLIPQEAAALLGISVDELLDAARRNAVEGVYLGGLWRFSSAKVLNAAAKQAVRAA